METTTNLGLKKPAQNEFYNIDDFNYNADKIDEEVNNVKIARHTHTNKTLLDSITAEQMLDWNDSATYVFGFLNDSRYVSMSEVADAIDSKTEANIKKNPDATDGDIIDTHLTVGLRTGTSGHHSVVTGGTELLENEASGLASAVIGGAKNKATAPNSATIGGGINTASGTGSVIFGGNSNTALAHQAKTGHFSKDGTEGTSSGTTGDAFIIGNGTSSAKSNCFRVSYEGYVYGGKTFAANSADVAELYEWQDGNPNKEDRRGLFVTLDGTKIKLASPTDTYIKGVISAQPCLVGDTYSDNWQGMYLKDVFGAYLKDEDGNCIINPDYDPTQEYIPREQRPEFDYVSNWGKLVLVDDGTCEVNGFATVGEGGKATKADTQTNYRVMERRDATHIYVSVG